MRTFFTDGSCSPNPGPGGFAVVEDSKPVALGHEKDSTNIRMEGQALIAALELADGEPCAINTDSEFWINVITKWGPGWKSKGWKKKSGPIKNLDLVQKLDELYIESDAELIWIKAHDGNEQNEIADEWANRARTDRLGKRN